MKSLSIVIVSFKSDEKTINYVNCELSKIKTPFYIIIVNNLSDENSDSCLCGALNGRLVKNILLTPDENDIYIIASRENLGFAKANNLAVDFIENHLKTEYILFSNTDIRIISYGIVGFLINKMEQDKGIGMIGPNCVDIDNNSQSPRPFIPFSVRYIKSFWYTPFVSKMKKNRLVLRDYPKNAREGDHYKISGSFFMVRLSDLLLCGKMDPNTFLYCEEEILTERMYSIGKRVYYCPDVTVLHEHNQTIGKFIMEKERILLEFESNSYYYQKYKNVSAFTILIGRITLNLNLFIRSILKIVFSKF